jgi:hypothetical protein
MGFPLPTVLITSWMKQHEDLEKLNLQSHHNAVSNSDEFVMESFITHDKFSTLVHELLAVEAWTDHVLPLLQSDISEKNSLRAYFVVRVTHCSGGLESHRPHRLAHFAVNRPAADVPRSDHQQPV